jgi:hypothetical protein
LSIFSFLKFIFPLLIFHGNTQCWHMLWNIMYSSLIVNEGDSSILIPIPLNISMVKSSLHNLKVVYQFSPYIIASSNGESSCDLEKAMIYDFLSLLFSNINTIIISSFIMKLIKK